MKKIFWWIVVGLGVLILGGYFARWFSGELPVQPVAFTIGKIKVYWYGIFATLGAIAGYYLLVKRVARYSLVESSLPVLAFFLILAGLLGARLGYVVQNWDYFGHHPSEIFFTWRGGLTFYGAVIAGILTVLGYSWRTKKDPWRLLDFFAPALLLGLAIGRFGNFFNQEIYGYPTDLPWRMFVAPEFRLAQFRQFEYFHPVFLYEAIPVLLLLVMVLWLEKRNPAKGIIFLTVIVGYALIRFGVEFFRIGEKISGNLTLAQLVSAGIFLLGTAILVRQIRFFSRSKFPNKG